MTGAPPGQPFPRRARLLSGADFDRVYALRWRVVDANFSVNAARNELGYARLGLSIGAKAVGNAVARNRVKRQVRESQNTSSARGMAPGRRIMRRFARASSRSGKRSETNAPFPDWSNQGLPARH